MKREYVKITNQSFDENMNPIAEIEETIYVSLIADTGKKILQKSTGIMGTRVDVGYGDSEDNYEEVDDPVFTEVIDAIESAVNS